MSLNYLGLAPVLIRSIQEQQVVLEQKNAEIGALKAQNIALDARLSALEQMMARLLKQEGKQEK